MRPRPAAVAAAAALVLAACAGGDGGGTLSTGATTTAPAGTGAPGTGAPGTGAPGTGTPATTGPPADPAAVSARLVRVAEVTQPTAMAVRPGDSAIYVAEKTGRVRAVAGGQSGTGGPQSTVLDLSGQVSGGTEQGLLGIVFSPDGNRLYVDYTDRDGDTRVVEYAFAGGRADPGSARELLRVAQPFANHNGGQLAFGPDGLLYIALGDGGSGNDPLDHAQNLGTLLGSILRIDPRPSGNLPYTVPAGNPFVGREGARAEIWAYGLRNPWRFSFDRQTGALWIGDVGQSAREEITVLARGQAGANLGWPLVEGTQGLRGANPEGGVLPVFEYGRDGGCSVIGGYVYRGSRVAALRGVYVYGDACSGRVWGLVERGGTAVSNAELALEGLGAATTGGRFTISSFGEDAAGELYLLSLGGGVYRIEA